AMRLEEKALNDDYFVERKLYPNVDFYTGLIYSAMGFPTRMFTPLFALGRLPGWIAQWREMITDEETRIGRPRQVYVAHDLPHYPGQERSMSRPPPPPVSGGFVLSSYKTPPICLLPGPGLASSLAIYPRGSTTRLGCHLRPTVVMLMPRPHSAVEWCQSSTG